MRLPKLPDPDNVFSAIEKASSAIDKGLGFIDKVSDKLDQLGISDVPSTTPTTAPESPKEGLLPAALPKQPVDIATGCLPCAIGHFSTSSGLLKEAVRFKSEGITSNEILDRIATALEEQNALEREDLSPEKIQGLPAWERPIAEEALDRSRQLRHRLESIQSVDELEALTADTKRYYIKLFRQWNKGRFGYLGDKKAEIISQRIGPEESDGTDW